MNQLEERRWCCEVISKPNFNANERNTFNMTPIRVACWYNHTECAKLLISGGADINEKENGKIILHIVCQYGRVECAKFAISRGTNIDRKDNFGNTPLHDACSHGYTECIKLLISNGANVNEKNNNGGTTLHYACFSSRIECAKLLISNGANTNERNIIGQTPFDLLKKEEHKKELIKYVEDTDPLDTKQVDEDYYILSENV